MTSPIGAAPRAADAGALPRRPPGRSARAPIRPRGRRSSRSSGSSRAGAARAPPGRSSTRIRHSTSSALRRAHLESVPEPLAVPRPVEAAGTREVRKTVTAVFVGFGFSPSTGSASIRSAPRVSRPRSRCGSRRPPSGTAAPSRPSRRCAHGRLRASDRARGRLRCERCGRRSSCGCARRARRRARAERGVQLDFRIGVSTGEVVTGADAESQRPCDRRAAYSSRPQIAPPGQFVIDDATRSLVTRRCGVARGRERCVASSAADESPRRDTCRPSRLADGRPRARAAAAARRLRAGRQRPLLPALHCARCRRCREVAARAGVPRRPRRQRLVARGRCLPYGEGITFWPLARGRQRRRSGSTTASSPERGASEAARTPSTARRVARVTAAAGGATRSVSPRPAAGSRKRFAAVRALFEALARTQPLVLVFDDIHWGEPTFLDLVEHLADWCATRRSCSSAWRGPSCSTPARRGAAAS